MNGKVLKWNFIFQYGFVLTNIFNALLLLPLYIRHIDATTLGLWLATGNILAWITTADPGIGDVLQQRIAEQKGRNEVDEISLTIGSGLMATVGILFISLIIGTVFYFFLGNIIDKDLSKFPDLLIAFVVSIVATGLSLVSFGVSGINQGMHNSRQVAISSILSNFLFLIINVVLLYMGFGVISIAIANMLRALYINLHNIVALLVSLKHQGIRIIYQFAHFKVFIRIFSFTSLSRIVSRVSENIDLIILARYIPASLITVFEINRRPINISKSLIGRHSVALMPVLSHLKGKGDREGILDLINKQFKYYAYAALLASFLFLVSYYDLITAWTGEKNYAGDTIVYILVVSFFLWIIGYFMSNVAYALGDIKMNSVINVAKGILVSILSVAVAKTYGIMGVLVVSLGTIVVMDLVFFTYRLYHIGYFPLSFLRQSLQLWAVVIPAGIALVAGCHWLNNNFFAQYSHIVKVLLTCSVFTPLFLALLLLVDSDLRNTLKFYASKIMLKRRLVAN